VGGGPLGLAHPRPMPTLGGRSCRARTSRLLRCGQSRHARTPARTQGRRGRLERHPRQERRAQTVPAAARRRRAGGVTGISRLRRGGGGGCGVVEEVAAWRSAGGNRSRRTGGDVVSSTPIRLFFIQ